MMAKGFSYTLHTACQQCRPDAVNTQTVILFLSLYVCVCVYYKSPENDVGGVQPDVLHQSEINTIHGLLLYLCPEDMDYI